MKKIAVFVVLLVLGSSALAGDCEVESFSVNWTAFKTPAKIGVKGSFTKPELETRQKKDVCLMSFLPTTTVHIDTSSVKTDSTERDANIVNAFFKNMTGEYIDAIIKRVDLEKKELSVEITMNDITQTIFMPFTYEDKTFHAIGKIDVLNFSASEALKALNTVCLKEHEGKTWSDVEVSFTIKMKTECR